MAQINILKTSASLVQNPPEGFVAIYLDENSNFKVLDETGSNVLLADAGVATSSYAATASYLHTARTASYALSASHVTSASYGVSALGAVYVDTASYADTIIHVHTASRFNTPVSSVPSASYALTASTFTGTLSNQFRFRFPHKYDSAVHFGRSFSDGGRLFSSGQTLRWDGYFFNDAIGTHNAPIANPPSEITKIYTSTRNVYLLGNNGVLYAGGLNDYGQLGDGTTTANYLTSPIAALSGSGKTVVDFWSLTQHYDENQQNLQYCYAKVNDNGTLKYYGWGRNNNGQLGLGATSNTVSTPTEITTFQGSDIVRIASTYPTTYFVSSSGELYACGTNGQGQLADGTTNTRNTPGICYYTSSRGIQPVNNCADVAPGMIATDETVQLGKNAFYRTIDGDLYGVGYNSAYELGNNTTTNQNYFTAVYSGSGTTTPIGSVVDIQNNMGSGFALDSSGSLWGWGYNGDGTFGDGTTTNSTVGKVVAIDVKEFWMPRRTRDTRQIFFTKWEASENRYVTYAGGYNGTNYALGVGSTSTRVLTYSRVRFPRPTEYAVAIQPLGLQNNGGTDYMATMFLTNENRVYVVGRLTLAAGNIHATGGTLSAVPLQITDIPL